MIFKKFFFIFYVCAVLVSPAAFAKQKVIIFTASFGQGHNTAAKVLAKRLQAENPDLEIKIQDILEFSTAKFIAKLQQKHYNDVTQTKPWLFRIEYELLMRQIFLFTDFGPQNMVINKDKMRDFLYREKPDLIASTYFFATASVIQMRKSGELPSNIPLVWTHTDYDDSKYFYKHAKNSDMTFAPSQEIADAWIKRGLDPKKITVSGMLVSEDVNLEMSPDDKNSYLKSKGLNPEIPVVAIAGGGEGMVDYEVIIKSIAKEYSGPLQIVVLAGKNEEKRRAVEGLKLRPNMTLKAEGFIPNIEVIKYAKSAAVYVTKPGGFSSTESVASRARSVFINIMGAQEGRNADYFESSGMALVTNEQDKVGEKVALILNNPSVGDKLFENSAKMKNNLHGNRVTEYVFKALSDTKSRAGAWTMTKCQTILMNLKRMFFLKI